MDALIDSTFVPLLAKSIGFLALAFLVWPLARRQSAAFQSIYWRGVMSGLLVLGVFSLWIPILSIEMASPSSTPAATPAVAVESGWHLLSSTAVVEPTGNSLSSMAVTGAPNVANPLLTIWAVGSAVLVLLFLIAQWRLSRMRSRGENYRGLLDECRAALGMRGPVRLGCSDRIAMPCAWGILRPTVMLPKSAESWDRERQRMVLMHELSHLRRRDPMFDFIGRLGVAFFWINPLSWLAFKQLRLAAERATDDAVIAGGVAATPYASLLLQFAKEGLAGRRMVLAAATPMAQRSTVGLRVEKILDVSQKRNVPRRLRTLIILGAAALCAAGVGGLQSSRAQAQTQPEAVVEAGPAEEMTGIEFIRNKLRKTIIPEVNFTEATLEEAVAFLRRAAKLNDKLEDDEERKGVNIILKQPGISFGKIEADPINLQLTNVPLEEAIKFTAELAGWKYVIDPLAVILVPPFVESGQLITRSFRVPAGFLKGAAGEPADSGSITAVSILEAVGIPFPDGASAAFIPATSELIVRNTRTNMDLVEVFVDSIIQDEKLRQPVNMRAEIYSLPSLQALAFLEQSEKRRDAVAMIAELRKLVADGKSKLVGTPSLTTIGGQLATIGSGTAYDYTANYIEVRGKDWVVPESCFVGTTITFAPRIGSDGVSLSADIKVEKTFGELKIEKTTVAAPVSGKQMPVERVTIERATIDTSTKLFSGQTRMLGSLSRADGTGDEVLLVFVKMWILDFEPKK